MKPRAVFIGGCGRSGTTLLGAMLGSHPKCLATPEAKFNAVAYLQSLQRSGTVDMQLALERIQAHWSFHVFGVKLDVAEFERAAPGGSYADLVLWIVEQYGRRVGKAQADVWVDHTPANMLYANTLFDLYPDAKLLHLVRDGRAVAASVMKLDWGPNRVDKAAEWWVSRLAYGFAAELHFGPERVMRVRYEDLVSEPSCTLQKVTEFLELDYRADMIGGVGFQVPAYASQGHTLVGSRPDPARIHAWQSELSARQIEIIESSAGALLRYLGYELLNGGYLRRMSEAERICATVVDLYREMSNRFHRRQRMAKAVVVAGNTKALTAAAQGDPV
ncbi:MAG: sulfotransferase [Caldilineaceae bacterium]|nr:sulfotransferase [Caldilineaceae bacterium]